MYCVILSPNNPYIRKVIRQLHPQLNIGSGYFHKLSLDLTSLAGDLRDTRVDPLRWDYGRVPRNRKSTATSSVRCQPSPHTALLPRPEARDMVKAGI
jgi:hypothetical protein